MSGLPILTRHEPARNMARLTRLEIASDLFDGCVAKFGGPYRLARQTGAGRSTVPAGLHRFGHRQTSSDVAFPLNLAHGALGSVCCP